MAIPRVDITAEINDWQNAVYGEEVRSANVSALTKLQTQMNDACDEIENAVDDVTAAVGTAEAAATTANAASTAAQTAITQAQTAITTAQGFARAAESSAQDSAGYASDSQNASNNAQTYAANASQSANAAESAAQRAETIVAMHPDEVSITKALDGELSVITLSNEEIEMSTDMDLLEKQVPSAKAHYDLNQHLVNIDEKINLVDSIVTVNPYYVDVVSCFPIVLKNNNRKYVILSATFTAKNNIPNEDTLFWIRGNVAYNIVNVAFSNSHQGILYTGAYDGVNAPIRIRNHTAASTPSTVSIMVNATFEVL